VFCGTNFNVLCDKENTVVNVMTIHHGRQIYFVFTTWYNSNNANFVHVDLQYTQYAHSTKQYWMDRRACKFVTNNTMVLFHCENTRSSTQTHKQSTARVKLPQ